MKVSIIQLNSGTDLKKNLSTCADLVAKAAAERAQLVCLPENFAYLGETNEENLAAANELNPDWLNRYLELAKAHRIWLSLGGFPIPSNQKGKFFNAHLLVDSSGSITARYDKMHLFSLQIPEGPQLDEAKLTVAGDRLVVADSPIGKLGLSICFDLRFGDIYRQMAKSGALAMLIPAAFTDTTGKAHWEILLRARAIETQSYVIAAAQTGRHNKSRKSYGHSMVVDPWGAIVAQCSEGEGLAFAEINSDYVAKVRARMPVI